MTIKRSVWPGRATREVEAYQAYLKGGTREQTDRGVVRQSDRAFRGGDRERPGLRGRTCRFGRNLCPQCWDRLRRDSPGRALRRAQAQPPRAEELDETLVEGHALVAYLKYRFDWDWNGAELEFKRALELNPGHAPSHHSYGMFWVNAADSTKRCRKCGARNSSTRCRWSWRAVSGASCTLPAGSTMRLPSTPCHPDGSDVHPCFVRSGAHADRHWRVRRGVSGTEEGGRSAVCADAHKHRPGAPGDRDSARSGIARLPRSTTARGHSAPTNWPWSTPPSKSGVRASFSRAPAKSARRRSPTPRWSRRWNSCAAIPSAGPSSSEQGSSRRSALNVLVRAEGASTLTVDHSAAAWSCS